MKNKKIMSKELLILLVFFLTGTIGCSVNSEDKDVQGFSFIYMGDSQADPEIGDYTAWGRMLQQAAGDESRPAFIMIGGDLINNGNDQEEWNAFFAAGGETLKRMKLYPAVGNHDNSELFKNIFDLPDNGPEGKKEAFYSFDYGNVHFTVMDSNAMGAAEQEVIDWLKKDLAATDKMYKIVMFHHPPYLAVEIPKDMNRAKTIRNVFVPVMEEAGVNLVLSGNQHVYMRTHPILNGKQSEDGIVYLIGTSGGKQYTPTTFDYAACTVGGKSVYSIVHVNEKGIYIETRDAAGNVVDSTRVDLEPEQQELSLLIKGDGLQRERNFTLQELADLPHAGFQHIYSTVNNWPTPRFYAAQGISLRSILKAAGVLDTAQIITFRSPDSYEVSFTRDQLLDTPRYYFPQVKEGLTEMAELVEPIIAYAYKEGSADMSEVLPDVPCLIIGQSNPKEQTNPAFVVNVCEIIVSSHEAKSWEEAGTFPAQGKIPSGESVKLQHKYYGMVKLHYTLDGTDPNEMSPVYNISTYQPELNEPITIDRDTVIKVLAIGYGKKNSAISSFVFEAQ